MVVGLEELVKAVEEARARAKRRRFVQTYELIIKLRDFDPKKPENRFNITIPLPHPIPNKQARVCVIASGAMVLAAKEAKADMILTREDVEKVAGNKKEIRKLARAFDFFVATPDLMALIGRAMGQILGPRGKMPEVVQPNVDLKGIVERLRRSVRVRVKDQPQVMVKVGSEEMEPRKVAENAVAIIEELLKRVKPEQVEAIRVKLTMGPPVLVKPK